MSIKDPRALLNLLLANEETPWLEFKHNNDDPQEIGEYISALANSAMLADRDRAFLVFGIENSTRKKVGTQARLKRAKKGTSP
jgi:predicted HTH transcriptional regulator